MIKLIILIKYENLLKFWANFDSILKSIKNLLNMWKWRGLTLLGKIQIVKSLIIPKVLSKAALISVSEEFNLSFYLER